MRVDDLMEVLGAMAKLNRTIDNQQQIIDKYHEIYGPLPIEEVSEQKDQKTELATP